jgi:hypothetical protein
LRGEGGDDFSRTGAPDLESFAMRLAAQRRTTKAPKVGHPPVATWPPAVERDADWLLLRMSGMTISGIARRFDRDRKTVRSGLARATARLEASLQPYVTAC